MGARPGRALLHQRDVPADRRPAGLHDVRQARDRVHHPVAVAAPRLRPPPLRRGGLPPPRPRQVHGLRRGLRRAQPHAVAHVPARRGGAPEGDRAQGLRALHAQVPLPGARLHGVRVLDAVPGAVERDARRRAEVHGPAELVPGRAGPGVEPRRR
uniref:Uncharacterized protein n=1 Tax=Triticum urartu TaxID=4572 RepID=A0A8R7UUC0_TRIUA